MLTFGETKVAKEKSYAAKKTKTISFDMPKMRGYVKIFKVKDEDKEKKQ